MRSSKIISCIAYSVFLMIANPVLADMSATRTMADITISLKHFPSDEDKQELTAIINSDDSSEYEIAVATAISKFQHSVTAADKEKLNSIIADTSTPHGLRTVASALLRITHSPTQSDIEKLQEIASDSVD